MDGLFDNIHPTDLLSVDNLFIRKPTPIEKE